MTRRAAQTTPVALALAALAFLLAAATPGPPTMPPAPDFTLTLLDGKTLTLADLKGKPVLLNFWWSG